VALLREDADDVSALTNTAASQQQAIQGTQNSGNSGTAGVTRSISEVSLDNVGHAFSRHCLNAYKIGIGRNNRNFSNIHQTGSSNEQIIDCCEELDMHADTCGVNHVARILEYHSQVAKVSSFSDTMEPLKDVPIAKAAIAYDNPNTGESIVLIINQALYFGKDLSHILLNPNQMRANEVIVEDIPTHLSATSSHSIIIKEEDTTIPLNLMSVISFFRARTPTMYEVENCRQIVQTSEEEWLPYSSNVQELEDWAKEEKANISVLTINEMEHSDIFILKLRIMSTQTIKKHLFIQGQELAKQWSIGTVAADNTIKAMTQRFVRNALHPIECRFRTKNIALKYNHLKCRLSSDTFFSGVKSALQKIHVPNYL
jgi:hypothetical protein